MAASGALGLGMAAASTATTARAESDPPAAAVSIPTSPASPVAPPAPEEHWYDTVKFEAFVDAYTNVNYNFPKPQGGTNQFRAPDVNNGFALTWVGLDVVHEAKPVGGTISLRFGPASSLFAGADTQYGLQYVRQAFATWKPTERLALDLGKFDTICCAEVPDSQKNMNYTRGVLYWVAEPLFHTGLRAAYQVTDAVTFRLMAVNGWNNSIDNNLGKSFGAQIAIAPVEQLSGNITYIGGPERSDTMTVTCPAGQSYSVDAYACVNQAGATGAPQTVEDKKANSRWRQFVDALVNYNPTDSLAFALNGDFGYDTALDPLTGSERAVYWYGGMAAGRLAFNDVWAVALRGEWFRDPQGFMTGATNPASGSPLDVIIRTGTLTLEAKPSPYLIVRLENRIDSANQPVFRRGLNDANDVQVTSLLGVVVTTGHTFNAPASPAAPAPR
ncbi:MAG TPA: porin [Polyangiaceae bacterium]